MPTAKNRHASRVAVQPDFDAMFYRKQPWEEFALRPGANWHHDVIFMSSLLHDAKFCREDVRLTRHRCHIGLVRDCWECYRGRGALISMPCRLTLAAFASWEWVVSQRREESAFLLRGLDWVAEREGDGDRGQLVLCGAGFALVLRCSRSSVRVAIAVRDASRET